VRDEAKGEAARTNLSAGRSLEAGAIEVWKLDLSAYDSITKLAERASSLERLDIAVLNAGVYKVNMTFNAATGYEEDVQVNYLSTALLTILLLPVLKVKKPGTTPGRLTIVSSDTAALAKFNEKTEDPLLPAFKAKTDKWDMQERYSTSKLLVSCSCPSWQNTWPRLWPPLTRPTRAYATDRACSATGPAHSWASSWASSRTSCPISARALTAAAVKFGDEVHGQYVEDGKIRP